MKQRRIWTCENEMQKSFTFENTRAISVGHLDDARAPVCFIFFALFLHILCVCLWTCVCCFEAARHKISLVAVALCPGVLTFKQQQQLPLLLPLNCFILFLPFSHHWLIESSFDLTFWGTSLSVIELPNRKVHLYRIIFKRIYTVDKGRTKWANSINVENGGVSWTANGRQTKRKWSKTNMNTTMMANTMTRCFQWIVIITEKLHRITNVQ